MALQKAGRCIRASPWVTHCRRSGRRENAHRVCAVSIDVQSSADEQTTTDKERQVPLPQAFPEEEVESNVVPSPITTLEDLTQDDEVASTNFSLELDKNQSLWLLNLVSFLYGTNTTLIKDTIEQSHLSPSLLCALRYGMAAVMLLPLLLKPGIRKINFNLSFELGLSLFVAYQCQARELVTESASEGSIMLAVYLLLVPLVELLFGRAFTVKKAASLAVAVGGVGLLAVGGGSEATQAASSSTFLGIREGTLWGLTSAIAFAFHLVRSEIRQNEAEDIAQLAAGQLVVCGILSALLLGWTGFSDPEVSKQVSWDVISSNMPWIPFLITLLFGSVLAQSGELVAVGKVPASTASLTLSLVVVWGLVCGALVNHDRLAPLSCVGAGAIVVATIVPKVLDVFADRSATAAAAEEKDELLEHPPVTITSEEFVRTTVSASVLAATPVLTEAGVMNTTTSTAASAITRQVVTAAAETSLSTSSGAAMGAASAGSDVAAAGAVAAADVFGSGGASTAVAGAATGTAASSTTGSVTVGTAAGSSAAAGAASKAITAAGAASTAAGAASTAAGVTSTAATSAATSAAASAATTAATSAATTAATSAATTAATTAATAAATTAATTAAGSTAATTAAASTAATAAASTAATTAASTAATTAASTAATAAAASTAAASSTSGLAAAAAGGAAAAAAGGAAALVAGSGGDPSNVLSGAADIISSGSTVIDAASAAAGPTIENITSSITSGSNGDGSGIPSIVDSAAAAAGAVQGVIDSTLGESVRSVDSSTLSPDVKEAVKSVGDNVAGSIRSMFSESDTVP